MIAFFHILGEFALERENIRIRGDFYKLLWWDKKKNYSINKSDLTTYYNIGKLLKEAGKQYVEGIIKEYSKRLTNELGKGYSISNLKNMRNFYVFF